MTVRFIRDATIDDVKRELSLMMHEGIADPTVRRLAEEAVAGKENQLGAVYEFVRNTFPYQPDPLTAELFIHPRRIAEDYYSGRIRSGDCDDHALLSSAMLGSLGYQARIILQDMDGDGELDHAYAQVETKIGWTTFDTSSHNPMGWVYQAGQTVVIN